MNYQNLTKDKLINELKSIKEALNSSLAQNKRQSFELNERSKELNCHNKISELMNNLEISIDETIDKITNLIPESFQFSDIATACITIYGKTFKTCTYHISKHIISQDIHIKNIKIGSIEVCYSNDFIPKSNPLFLKEEADLLFSIAVRISNFIEKKEKEITLHHSEIKYKNLIENITNVVYEIDDKGIIKYISPAIEKLIEYKPDEIIGKEYTYFVGGNSEFLSNRLNELSFKHELEYDYKLHTKFGTPCWVRLSTKAILEDGIFKGATGTVTNITEKKLTEIELQKSETLYKTIINASPDVITITDLEGKIILSSPKALELFGYQSQEELLHHSFFEFIDKSDHKRAMNSIQQMLNGIYNGAEEYHAIKSDGRSFEIEVNADFIKNDDGMPEKIIFVTRDISNRKVIEARLQKSEVRYRNLVESINEIVYEIDGDGVILFISPSIEEKYGYKQQDIIGRKVFDFIYFEDLPMILKAFSNLDKKEYVYLEYRYVLKNGNICWVRSSTNPVFKDGKLIGGSGSIIDINDLKLAQLAVIESEEKYSKAFNTSSYAILISQIDDGRFVEVNPAFTEISGYTREEALADSSIGLKLWVDKNDREKVLSILKSGKDVLNFETKFRIKNGDIIYASMSSAIIYLNGKPNILSSINNITEQKKAEKIILKANRLNSVISHINKTIVREKDKNKLLKEVCKIAIDQGKFQMAWIGEIDKEKDIINPIFFDGKEDGYLSKINRISIKENSPTGNGPAGIAIRNGRKYVCNDIENDPIMTPWRKEALKRSYYSTIALPLKVHGEIFGALMIYSSIPFFFNEDEITLLTEVVDNISFALDAIDLEKERNEMLEALTKSQYNLKEAQKIAKIGSWVYYLNGETYWSDEMYIINGVSKATYIPNFNENLKIISSEDRTNAKKWISDCLAGKKINEIEFKVCSNDGTFRYIYSRCELNTNANGEPISITGISQDITERKLAELELLKLSRSVEQSPVSIVITNLDGIIEYANPKSCETTGYSYNELIGQNPRVLKSGEMVTEDYKALWNSITKGNEWRGLFHNKKKTGELYWESATISPITDSLGNTTHYLAIKEDITEQLKMQNALEKSEERFSQIAEQSKTIIWEANYEGLFTYVSPVSTNVLGYTPQELVNKLHFYDLQPLENKELMIHKIKEIVFRKETITNLESQIVTKNGNRIWVSTNAVPVIDKNGLLLGYRGADNDITERKHSEEELLKFRTISDKASYGSVITTLEGDIIYINDAFAKMHRVKTSYLIGKNLFVFHNKKQHARVNELLSQLFKLGSFSSEEVWHERKDGTEFPTLMNATLISNEKNEPQFLSATAIDITALKHSQDALIKSESSLNYAQEIAKMGSWEYSFITNTHNWSRNYVRIFEFDPCDKKLRYNDFFNLVHPDDVSLMTENLEKIVSNKKEVTSVEFRLMLPNNKIKWVQNNIVPIFEDDKLIGLNGVLIDITEKKLDEQKIKQQNERLNAILNAVPDLIFISDNKGTYLEFYAPKNETLLYPTDKLIGANVKDVFDEETAKLHLQKINECLTTNNLVTYEYNSILNNKTRYFEARLVPISGERVLRFVRDYTERKLQDFEISKLSLAVEQSPVSILITDLEGKMEYANPAFIATTGYKYSEIIGQNTRMLKSGSTDKATYTNLWNTIKKGEVWHGEWINKKKNGELYWENILITPIHDKEQKITNYLAVKQDITNRKKAEQEIQDLNLNLELKIKERTAQLAKTNENLYKEIEERKQAEKALLLKSKELENFFSVSLDLLCIADVSGNFIKLNSSWETSLGYSISEMEQRKIIDFVHPDDVQLTLDALTQLSEQKPVFEYVNRYRTKDGSYRVMEWHSVPVGEILYSAARDITERKRAEEFENELLQLSTKLTGVRTSEIDLALNLALLRIGNFLKADRSYIFEFSEFTETISNTFEWCNDGINPEIDNLQNIPCEALPMWMDAMNRRENIIISDISKLPKKWSAEREILEAQNIKSIIIIPMFIENKLIGFVGLDNVIDYKVYNNSEINILKVWSSMLSSLIKSKKADMLLEQTQQNYETFFNTIDDFLWVLDDTGNIIHANTTVKERLEYPITELENKSVLMVHPPERRDEAARIVGEMLQGTAAFCPVPIVTKSGKYIPVETRVKAGFWNSKPAIFGVSKDISQIQLSEQKFSSAFQSNSSMMAISNYHTGEFIDVNEEFLEKLGYTKDEVIGKISKDLNLFQNTNIRIDVLEKIDKNTTVKNIELEIKTKNGDKILGLFSAEIIFVGNDKCLLTSFIDITERKKSEIELQKARIEAERANMAKSEFLSRMSHELRTPMNSILGFAQLLQMGDLNLTQSKSVNHILHSGKHLLDLINEVLEISRIEAGRLTLSLEPVKLDLIIGEMIDAVKPQLAERKVKIKLIDTSTNQLFVKSDRQRLKQVLLNLIINGIKYNNVGGTIKIKTELKKHESIGIDLIRISISDTGKGIPTENISKLFTPFERIGAERSDTEGTGLGLAVVKKLIDAMNGFIGVESTINKGSTFWIELPSCESQLENLAKLDLLNELKTDIKSTTGTILYVEDNVSNIELIKQILMNQRSGIKLISTMYGKKAVQFANEYKPDLILLDLDLPDMHGSKVIRELLMNKRTMSIPIVIISADAMPNQLKFLQKAGAKDYLTKPLDIVEFLKIVDRFITQI